MKTHGGRAFLRGHLFGENVHEYLAPCIYEGEGEMLGMGFFKSLIKEHGKTYFEPIGRAAQAAGIKKPNPLNPAHAWALRTAIAPYAAWRAGQALSRIRHPELPAGLPPALAAHARFAARGPPARPPGDQRHDGQAPAPPGRPPVPHGRALAEAPGPRGHPRHQPLGRPDNRARSSTSPPTSSART
jgi:hypothetical protein